MCLFYHTADLQTVALIGVALAMLLAAGLAWINLKR